VATRVNVAQFRQEMSSEERIMFEENVRYVFICTAISYTMTLMGMALSCYLFWLTTFKSPASLHTYRYFLQLQTVWNCAFSFWIGFVAMPQNSCREDTVQDVAGGSKSTDKLMLISVRGLASRGTGLRPHHSLFCLASYTRVHQPNPTILSDISICHAQRLQL